MSTLAAELTPEYRFSPAPKFPRYCTSLLNRTCDFFWEARLGIHTTGGALSLHPDARDYGCLAYDTYYKIFDRLELQPDDVVVDIGCGKGRVVCVAATYSVKEVIGVDIDQHLLALPNRHAGVGDSLSPALRSGPGRDSHCGSRNTKNHGRQSVHVGIIGIST